MSKVVLTEEQLDLLAENELSRLRQVFRLMENDREAYSEEVKRILFKQKALIAQLEKEKAELETMMKCGESKAFQKKDEYLKRKLQQQLNEYDFIEYNIKKEGQELKELQDQIRISERELMYLKNKHNIQDNRLEEIKKQAKIDENLETRLHVETVKFNKLATENQQLREEIDHLLRGRKKFNSMFQQVVGKLDSGKKVLMDLIEQSTMAYDKREEALTKLEALRTKARQDLVQHSQEMRELKRKLDHEMKLHDFVGAKGAKRINVDLEGIMQSKRKIEKEEMELHLQEYKALLEQIKVYFNENDVDRLISGFLKVEEDNYNLFSFINELNKQMGVLREQLCEGRRRIEEQSAHNRDTTEEQFRTLESLRAELVVSTHEADEAESNLNQCQAIVEHLLDGIQGIFLFIQCDPTPLMSLLGSNTKVTKFNYKLYMNLIEKRVIDINNLVWYLAYSKVATRAAKLFPGQVSSLREPVMRDPGDVLPKILTSDKIIPTQPCPLCTEQEDISEVDETIAHPLTKEEIEEVMKEILFNPETEEKLHNVSACRLPKSRRIMQKRFHRANEDFEMLKKKNISTDELEMDQLAEAELTRLQRQYRIMEGDREAYSEEVRILLKKQRKEIERLEKEKMELVTNLECWKCRTHEMKDEKLTEDLKKLLSNHDALEQQIKYEKSQLNELEFQIKKVAKEVEGIKKKYKVKETNYEELQEKQRLQHQLENRLDVATVKFNRMLANNNKLRDEIDHLLKERTSFNHIYQELVNRRNNDKKIMLDLMEQSTLAYDQREEAQAKLEALKLKGKHDMLVHGQEMRELQRKLDHDSKLHEFLGLKGQKRVMADLEAKEALKKKQQKEELEGQIQKLQSILEHIKELTGETDIDRLSAQFLKQEEENYALFNYVNELNNEMECLQEQVDELKKNIEEQRELNKIRAQQKQATLQMLEAELDMKRKEAEDANEKLENCRNIINKLLEGIHDVFNLLKCDENPVLELFGEAVNVTSYNVMLYLGIIERRSSKLLRVVREWERLQKEAEISRLEVKSPGSQRSRSSGKS